MRRSEFHCDDQKLIESMLAQIEYGVMIIPDNDPYGVPISFCYHNNEIYFHGARGGRKYQLLKENPKVSFSATKLYSYIPTTFLHHTMIPTQFFFSVYINGRFETINDNQKKKYILHNLVKKYEPQEHIDMDSIQFKGQEKGVFVGIIAVESMTVKAKFGQNMKQEDREQIIRDLDNRETQLDRDTIVMMQRFKP